MHALGAMMIYSAGECPICAAGDAIFLKNVNSGQIFYTCDSCIMHDIENYHVTPDQASRVANDAGVKLLVFYHLLPAPDGFPAAPAIRAGNQRGAAWRLDDG